MDRVKHMRVGGQVIATIFFLARLIDCEETFKYMNGIGWC